MGHYPNSALFNPFFFLAGEWPKLFREIYYEKTRFDGRGGVPLFLANFPAGLLCPMPHRPLMVRAALLRRSDGAATESLLRRSCADQLLRRAHSARRVRDGADAAATELMLLRRS